MSKEIRCCICGVPTEFLLLDEVDKPPRQFCSWDHLRWFIGTKLPVPNEATRDTTGADYTLLEVANAQG